MNKYSLKEYLETELKSFSSSFKKTSLDTEKKEYLCQDESTEDVYDFDAYVRERQQKLKLLTTPASPDAIHIGKKNLYFIEFKNQLHKDIDKDRMQRKFESGTNILKELLHSFTARDCKRHFCVVFKNQTRTTYKYRSHIESRPIKFKLDELNREYGNFYDHIVTEDLDFYVKQYQQLNCPPGVETT